MLPEDASWLASLPRPCHLPRRGSTSPMACWHPAPQAHVECVEDTAALRDQLSSLGLVAFVGDGSILPRCGKVRAPRCPASWRQL